MIRSCFKIAANLRANPALSTILELGDMSKHLMTGPAGNSEFRVNPGNSEFCFPLYLNIEGLEETRLIVI